MFYRKTHYLRERRKRERLPKGRVLYPRKTHYAKQYEKNEKGCFLVKRIICEIDEKEKGSQRGAYYTLVKRIICEQYEKNEKANQGAY
ncbi:MAG: hypothetical protein IJF76_00440 [Clostridia bacterium]|nr:hypothetical protein [Clostridia bacterium]